MGILAIMMIYNEKTPLAAPVDTLKGVGARIAEKLAKLNVMRIMDVLFHLPFRYEDRTTLFKIGQVRPGQSALIEGEIELVNVVRGRRLTMMCRLSDGTGMITLRFFHFSNAQRRSLERGKRLRCFGEVRFGASGYEMAHPEYHFIQAEAPVPLATTLTPVYPSTEGVSQLLWRRLTDQALEVLQQDAANIELLPEAFLAQAAFPMMTEALMYVHRPPVNAKLAELIEGRHPAQQRLALEELLAHQLSLRTLREKMQKHAAYALPLDQTLQAQFLKQLPFELTQAQQRVSAEIARDLTQPVPMLRLVQGDVGSGKTVVAAMAILQAIAHQKQAVIMAPTEILAEQHYNNFSHWLTSLGIKVGWLSSQVKGKKRETVLRQIKQGELQIMVGTHALFQKGVFFNNLALVVIDEQHRFGVHQRLALHDKGKHEGKVAHQLIMTATPIPRTLAMSAYADLDQSVIDELPPGRKPVQTVAIDQQHRLKLIERIRVHAKAGRQVYWVCTLIEESEVLQCQAAEKTAELLVEALPDLRVALIHGRLKAAEKESLMQAFSAHAYDILVATTVIEVGVDVPNATLMVIENPERLGLAQLHQLRGRVGRGTVESHCVLLFKSPLSKTARERLNIMRQTQDGFVIAEKDLMLRGPGEVLGTKQTGDIQMRIADLLRDAALVPKVQMLAQALLDTEPGIAAAIIERWLGASEKYAQVG
jgi:ATP-dependent DNA helicase RecG